MLKRYNIKNDKPCEGWAIIVIDTEIGYFSTVSDFGNYAYIWSAPGGEFRQFLVELEVDYLRSKLLHGRSETVHVDTEATKKAIREGLRDHAKHAYSGKPAEAKMFLKAELAKLKAYDFEDMFSFEAWTSDTMLSDAYEYIVKMPDPQCTGFCERVYPRFVKMLEDELEKERADEEQAARLRENVDRIRAEVQAHIEERYGIPE